MLLNLPLKDGVIDKLMNGEGAHWMRQVSPQLKALFEGFEDIGPVMVMPLAAVASSKGDMTFNDLRRIVADYVSQWSDGPWFDKEEWVKVYSEAMDDSLTPDLKDRNLELKFRDGLLAKFGIKILTIRKG